MSLLRRPYPLWTLLASAIGGALSVASYWAYHHRRKRWFLRLDFHATIPLTRQLVNDTWFKYDVEHAHTLTVDEVNVVFSEVLMALANNHNNTLQQYVDKLSAALDSSHTQRQSIFEMLQAHFRRLSAICHTILPHFLAHLEQSQYDDLQHVVSNTDALLSDEDEQSYQESKRSETATSTQTAITQVKPTPRKLVTTAAAAAASSSSSSAATHAPSSPPPHQSVNVRQNPAVASKVEVIERGQFVLLFSCWLENKIVQHVTVNLL